MKIWQKDDFKKEFLELTKRQNFSVDEAIDKLMEQLEDDYLVLGSNNVCVYMGTCKLVHESDTSWYPVDDVLVGEDDPTAEYKAFCELDTGLKKWISIGEDLESFEQNNTIIFIPNVRNFERKFTFEEDFKKLRKIYLRELCLSDEQTALSLVTSEDYIKQVFSVENYMKENNISSVFYQAFYDAALCNSKKNSCVVLKKEKKSAM